ncbi:MAG: restriction endonuclease subunit S [Cyanobacteria bacterium]|nr:restriction endonuclease subunit S [Cyanobacteriota bacterium]
MSELPRGWIKVEIGKLTSIQTGKLDANAAVKDGPYPFFTCAEEVSRIDRYAFDTQAILLAGNGIFNLKRYKGKFNVYQRTYVIEPIGISFDYCFYALKQAIEQIASKNRGSVIKYLRLGDIANSFIPIPPLNEQRRIVAKLDRLFARSRSAREELERIPKLCDRYKQAILAAAFRGDLTASWRQEKVDEYISSGLWSIPHQWQWHQMSEVCEHITKGTTPSKDKMSSVDAGIPFIKVYNLTFDATLDFSIDPTFVDLETHEKFLKRSRVYPGDVLMNIVGPPLGKVSIVPEIYPAWNINQAIAIFRARPKILNRFISNYLLFEKTVNWCIQEAKATAGQFNLTLRICQDIPIPVPLIEEQKEIVRQIEKLFKAIDLMAQEYQKASKLLDRLDQATLSKAFRGELVPQDPNDEPAAALLERILAERQNQTPAKRSSTKKAR